MKYLMLPQADRPRLLPFYFAVEEYVANTYTDDDYFFIWRVEPTVMLGRNQLVESEVNTDYCRANGIHIFRRKSGGGCIYADMGCMQFSYISDAGNVEAAFPRYMETVAAMLRSVGVDAERSGRNDILVGGRKVAGSAYYRIGRRSVLHNSLLFDTTLDHLSQALNVPKEKLQSKGVASVRQRVTNVGDHTRLTIDEFIAHARRHFCGDSVRVLSADDMGRIAEIERRLASPEFVYGKNPRHAVVRKMRFADVGTIEAYIEVKNNAIADINFVGDFFMSGDIDNQLIAPMLRRQFTREGVAEALAGTDVGAVVRGLTADRLLRLLFGRPAHVMKPDWLKIDLRAKGSTGETAGIIERHRLNTICTSGLCPNRHECWAARTATIMIGGDVCTRNCRFCNTLSGRPKPLDPMEPGHVAATVKALGLRYAVITSVDRDDLPDYGAAHWVETIKAIGRLNPETRIEVLLPDFMGRADLLGMVLDTRPYVAGHNLETVRRLTPSVRSVASYDRSLDVLRIIAAHGTSAKTGFMVGLGETDEEVEQTMDDILSTGCRRLTIGQYLQPTARHLPVAAYIHPDKFADYHKTALAKGFEHVESGPLVRSSYHAERAATD